MKPSGTSLETLRQLLKPFEKYADDPAYDDNYEFYVPRETPLSRDEAHEELLRRRDELMSFGIGHLSIAGSVARDEAGIDSDIDLIVDPDASRELFGRYFDAIAYLEDLFRCEIDLLTRKNIKPHARASIEQDEIPVF
ncbi:MAG: nucleotidyltransferase domain-containing protein [Candidatus Poribacteria bacterium]|nr:nucleotidyltransferase domain-containing protein [Candidatus Poribacteria bacterium]